MPFDEQEQRTLFAEQEQRTLFAEQEQRTLFAEQEQRRLFADLEQRMRDELARLPSPLAPATLLPRVLAVVDAWVSRPWYARAWFTWPFGWQAASVVLVALALYGTWVAPPLPAPVVATGNAGGVIWRALIEPLMGYVVGLVVLMGIACAVFGAALNYLFLERTASR